MDAIASAAYAEQLLPSSKAAVCCILPRGIVWTHLNNHLWVEESPHATVARSFQDRFKTNVLCGLVGDRHIGPHIFDQSLNANKYLNVLQNYFLGWIENFDLEFRKNLVYMQDGAPPHRARIITTYMNEYFPNNGIGYGSPYVQRLPRSPDLTPLNFYGAFENFGVSNHYRKACDQLVQQIQDKCDDVRADANTIQIATNIVERSSELCYDNSSGYFENIL